MRTLFTLLVCCSFSSLFAQTSRVEFGKNRVQYHRDFDEWEKYESDNFITYWYGNNQGVGQAVVQFAEYDFAYIQKMLESRLNEKVQLITYRDITDVKQSNIGAEEVFELSGNQSIDRNTSYVSGTQAKFLGNKAFVYFTGDHNDLRRQVREAMASVYIEQLLYGSSVQEVVQNAVLLNLPEWFKPGLVAYLGEDWNSTLDDQLRDILATGEYEDFNDLAADYPRLAGHSMWYYIAENLGKPTVSNLLYLTRINRSVENGFLYVLGSNYDTVLYNWQEFYRNRYLEDGRGRSVPEDGYLDIKNKKQLPITQLKVSPDGQRVAYVLNEIGKYKVYVQDVNTGERELLLKGGQRNLLQATDYAYPIIDFSPTNQELAVLYEFRDQPKLMLYDFNTKKKTTDILGIRLDRVLTMAYNDPNTFLISAMQDGFSDIYTYFPASRQAVKITNDHWDDLDAVPVNIRGRRGVVFSSNRPDTSLLAQRLDTLLPIGHYDLFYYDLQNKPGELVRITNTPLADERQPVAIDEEYFAFLSDENGIYNRFRGKLEDYIHHYEQTIYLADGAEIVMHGDSTLDQLDSLEVDSIVIKPIVKERGVTVATTDYNTNILSFDGSGKLPLAVESFIEGGETRVRRFSVDTVSAVDLSPTAYRRRSLRAAGQTVPQFTNRPKPAPGRVIRPNVINPEVPAVNDDGLRFQTRFKDTTRVAAPSPPVKDILSEDPAAGEDIPDATVTDTTGTRPPLTVVDSRPAVSGARKSVGRPTSGGGTGLGNPIRDERPIPELNRIYRFRPGLVTSYRTTFRVNYVKTTIDNEPLFNGMNVFAANPDGYTQQPVGILLKGNVLDLMEDYVIEGGVRVPTSFNGTEYFLTGSDVKHRLDRIYTLYRRNRREQQGIYPNVLLLTNRGRVVEENTLMAQYGVRYPLDIFRSLRATATVRRDRVQTVTTSEPSLANDPVSTERLGMRLEYVFDNTLSLGTNLLMGTRYKVYGDVFKSFNLSFQDGFDPQFEPGILGIVGFDARHYQRVLKRSIIALRVAAATNFGKQKILYYLGGADNSVINNFNDGIPTPNTGEFVYQDLANPLRGFDINIRNGGTYTLGNAELRVPVFNYLFNNVRSAFLRDFQLVGFFDIGTAWSGRDPFDEDNPVNITEYPDRSVPGNTNVIVRVRRFREPIVYGYGAGVRTTIFGYFIRADYGWGVETSNRQKGKLHLSLGLDF